MTGVAGPMFARDRRAGSRFLAGLLGGELGSAVLVGLTLYVAGVALHAVGIPSSVSAGLLVLICVGLGLADLLDRTPHSWRQVPQRLVTSLTPGMLGVTWGIDLGLYVTTQKVSSLIWVAMAASVLLDPASAPVLLIALALSTGAGVIVASTVPGLTQGAGGVRWSRWTQRTLRRVAGVSILILAGLEGMQVLLG